MENRFAIIHCPYTGRNYIYTKTVFNGKICVDIVRIDWKKDIVISADKPERRKSNEDTYQESV